MIRNVAAATRRAAVLSQSRFAPQVGALRLFHGASPAQSNAEAPLPPSLAEKYQLTDPTRYVPLTVGGFTFGWATGLYHFDPETQLLALWVLFCGTVYSRGGPIIAEMLDGMSADILAAQQKAEEAEIAAVRAALEANQRQAGLFSDVETLFKAQTETLDKLVAASPDMMAHRVRDTYVKKLDSVVALENKVSESTQKALVENATKYVKEAYLTGEDTSLKNNAMVAALNALSNPKDATRDASVGNLYKKYFATFGEKVKQNAGKETEIPKELAAELQEFVESAARREGLDASAFKMPAKASLTA
mmetsp:Transcript_20153/g.35822  ORF Transcript_20153/g.35822 Transcript_20153/m.35822 type:complete len:305 (-) Transcript_20153:49-963(-)